MMQAILEDNRTGAIGTHEVPEPELRPGGILVQTAFSAISSGTERVKVETAEKSLLGKAMSRPDLVAQVVDFARTNGIRAAYDKVRSKLDSLSAMGYSCSGTVIAVGAGVTGFQVGDRVACGGGGYANHCSVNFVPMNLAVKVPDNVPLEQAALTTIGAIAIQGLRQANVAFGETVLVVGAGLLGVLAIQIARASGCRVVAIDLDPARVENARAMGAQLALEANDPALAARVQEFSRYGPDCAVITAATSSAEPVETAARLLRDRGRIVIVGDVGMGVTRGNMYHKELSLHMSRSYGPGRYDPAYEEEGRDYPVGHVRWTEQRNMEAFLDLVSQGVVDLAPLTASQFPAEQGAQAYEAIRQGRCYTAILRYRREERTAPASGIGASTRPIAEMLRVGCIGAGAFAQSMIFPNVKKQPKVELAAVATASGHGAESARRSFGFRRAVTAAELLSDPQIHAVFIASRHQSHAEYVLRALEAGKKVFVEKPLAVDAEQLGRIKEAHRDAEGKGQAPLVMVGFNRRFAPMSREVMRMFANRQEPMALNIRINAGYLPADHWTQSLAEGGRIIGEGCHFIDWARAMTGAPIVSVSAAGLANGSRYNHDNVAIMLQFGDGSVANLLYLANGDRAVPKELYEVFCEGMTARITDFRQLEMARAGKVKQTSSGQDKGHRDELAATIEAMRTGKPALIPFAELVEVTEATFAVHQAISRQQTVKLANSAVSG